MRKPYNTIVKQMFWGLWFVGTEIYLIRRARENPAERPVWIVWSSRGDIIQAKSDFKKNVDFFENFVTLLSMAPNCVDNTN